LQMVASLGERAMSRIGVVLLAKNTRRLKVD